MEPVPAPREPVVDSGPGTLVYDGEHVAWMPRLNTWCPTHHGGLVGPDCDVWSAEENHTSNGAHSLLLTTSGNDYGPMGSLSGCRMPRSAYSTLEMWIYPLSADFEFRITLFDDRQPENASGVDDEHTVVNGLTPGTWNLVSVPMTTFGTADFNTVRFSSTNAPTTTFYLDDIRLLP